MCVVVTFSSLGNLFRFFRLEVFLFLLDLYLKTSPFTDLVFEGLPWERLRWKTKARQLHPKQVKEVFPLIQMLLTIYPELYQPS